MSATLPLLSPLVTRILELSGFPSELKTRDLQAVFAQWEDDRGGFRIKWVDDTTALVIFADAAPAKRAYLQTLMSPPPMLMNSTGIPAKIRPYEGDDASSIIASAISRPRSRSNAGGQATPAYGATSSGGEETVSTSPPSLRTGSISGGLNGSPKSAVKSLGSGHHRTNSNPSSLPAKPLAAALFDAANGGPSPAHHLANAVAAEVAAAAAASGNGSPFSGTNQSSPDMGGNATLTNALKTLPMNPITHTRPPGLTSTGAGTESPEQKKKGVAAKEANITAEIA